MHSPIHPWIQLPASDWLPPMASCALEHNCSINTTLNKLLSLLTHTSLLLTFNIEPLTKGDEETKQISTTQSAQVEQQSTIGRTQATGYKGGRTQVTDVCFRPTWRPGAMMRCSQLKWEREREGEREREREDANSEARNVEGRLTLNLF